MKDQRCVGNKNFYSNDHVVQKKNFERRPELKPLDIKIVDQGLFSSRLSKYGPAFQNTGSPKPKFTIAAICIAAAARPFLTAAAAATTASAVTP
jgi:hypothetical protein